MTLALVTGASRGIGRATAQELGRRGCRLALLGRESPGFADVVATLRSSGVEVSPFYCDLGHADQVERAARQCLDGLGVPDVLVNNAGISLRAPVVDMTLEHFDEHLAVNLRAPFLLTRAFLPGMLARASGRIVHVGSISSTVGTPHQAAYNTSKWAVVGFMKSLAEELRDTGVATVAVLPGAVDTDMLTGSPFPARMSSQEVAKTLVHYALDAPIAHNGGVVEMFGV